MCAEAIGLIEQQDGLAIAAERGLPLVPGHDPVAWPALTVELCGG